MIVLDTSAAIELILALPKAGRVQARLESEEWTVAAPQLLVVEVLQVLRRRVVAGLTEVDQADDARGLLDQLNIRYFDHRIVANRIWELRDNLTAYDAAYIALAEALSAELVTSDRRLANSPVRAAQVWLID